MKCKVCGKNAESEYCFLHKPKKQLQQRGPTLSRKKGLSVGKSTQKKEKTLDMQNLFIDIWKKRKHICENCGVKLGNEPRTYMFDHLLEKSKYPKLTFQEDNIMLVCLECHDNKTRGFISELIKQKIKKVREKFGI